TGSGRPRSHQGLPGCRRRGRPASPPARSCRGGRLMDLLFLFEVILAGIGSGGLYALAGLAFVIIYKATRVVNLAIGEMLMMGAYFFLTFLAVLELPAWAAVVLAVLLSGVMGGLIERLAIRPMLGEAPIWVFTVTGGLGPILVGLVDLIWWADQRRLPEFMPNEPIFLGEACVSSKVFYGFI